MKTIKYLLCLTIFVCFIACSNDDNGNNGKTAFYYEQQITPKLKSMNISRPTDSYNYPVYPGTKEWEQLSIQEAVDISQVPIEVLKKLSTQAVIQAIWEYPFLLDVVHRYQYQADFEATFLQNHAYKELLTRADAGTALLERLLLVNPVVPEAEREPKVLEIIISQPIFLSQLGNDAKKQLIEITLKNDELRQYNDRFAHIDRATAWLLIGRALINAHYAPFVEGVNSNAALKSFFDSKFYVYMEEVYGNIPQLIINYATDYLIKK